jgi:hypothetical protein
MSKKIKLTEQQLISLTNLVKDDEINTTHHKGSYMSLQSLSNMKTQIDELIHMIPDGVELDDWVEDHIIKAGDDIDEVYQFLKHKNV